MLTTVFNPGSNSGWFEAVRTLEAVGLVVLIVGSIMTIALLIYSSNVRMAKMTPSVLMFAGWY